MFGHNFTYSGSLRVCRFGDFWGGLGCRGCEIKALTVTGLGLRALKILGLRLGD